MGARDLRDVVQRSRDELRALGFDIPDVSASTSDPVEEARRLLAESRALLEELARSG